MHLFSGCDRAGGQYFSCLRAGSSAWFFFLIPAGTDGPHILDSWLLSLIFLAGTCDHYIPAGLSFSLAFFFMLAGTHAPHIPESWMFSLTSFFVLAGTLALHAWPDFLLHPGCYSWRSHSLWLDPKRMEELFLLGRRCCQLCINLVLRRHIKEDHLADHHLGTSCTLTLPLLNVHTCFFVSGTTWLIELHMLAHLVQPGCTGCWNLASG